MLQKSNFKKVIFPILSIFILSFLAVYFLGGYNQVEAQWSGPSSAPPLGNVEPPLRIDTQFSGHVIGNYNSLILNGSESGLNCTTSDSIIWDGEKFICGIASSGSTLLDILNNGSDASSFVGGIVLGDLISSSITWLDVGGPLTTKWLHATSTEGESVINHNLIIKGNIFISKDIAFNNGKSLRIDQEGTTTSLFIGNYADGLGFEHSNGDKADLFVEGIVDAESLCIKGNCVNDFNKIGIGIFKQLSTSTFNGSVGGYSGANDKCPTGMHVCTIEEILNTINKGLMPSEINGPAWISGGPPGYLSSSNDCNGWTTSTNTYLGRVWVFSKNYGTQTVCNSSLNFACCQ